MDRHYPTARSFRFVRNVCVSKLEKLEVHELRTILPSLVRMSQCQSVDDGSHWNEAKKEIQKVLCGLEVVNSVVSLLSVDFGCLRQDCVKEQQMQRKLEGTSSANTHSALVESLHEGLALDFERSESSRRLRLVLRELLRIMNKVVENKEFSSYENCELFQCEVYLDNVCDVLCIAQAELPEIFHLDQMAQALLRVPNGPWFICHLVANAPDYFEQVCSCLLTVEDKHNTTLPCYVRTETLCRLCTMNPDYALSIRSEAVQKCCLPELSIKLTLDFKVSHFGRKDLVEFLSGLLLGSDLHVRKWFAQFIKSGQKDHSSISSDALTQLREELLQELVVLTPMGHRQKIKGELQKERKQALGISQGKRRITVDAHDKETLEIIEAMDMSTDFEIVEENTAVPSSEVSHAVMEEQSSTLMKIADENVIYATGLLRLYCTLKGIAGMKLTNDEADELVCLITCRAPSTAAGVRFVTVGLSTVLACNIIGLSVERDKMVVKWMEWLSKEESHVETSGGQHISFGEQLLLMAIHFHSNNLEAIADLVSATLGMRARPGTLTKMKTVFTQELFPEKAITEHAVRVAVTPQLSSSDFGFLPIHCVYHLLKNRAFTKHSVQVKEWIFSQILSSSTPLHPLFVGVIDAFVKSVVMPLPNKHRRQGSSVTVDGFSETKILEVFESRYGGLLSSSTSSSLTTQLLLLYYLLTYKDCCLSNMKSLVSSNHQPADYSLALYSQIPIKYLIQQARKNQEYYRDLYPPLLRLLVTYYPHLCLVEDWLGEEDRAVTTLSKSKSPSTARITNAAVTEALGNLKNSPPSAMLMLLKLSKLDPRFLIHYADVIVQALREAVEPKVSRRIQTLLRDLWMKLNTMIPRRLWLATVNTLCLPAKTTGPLATTPYTDEELTKDPLTVLRCDRKTFRCAPVLSIIIRVLMGYLAASRAMLSQHLLANSNGKSSSASGGVNTEQEREELKSALLSAQESAVVQILLEICLQFKEEKQAKGGSMRHCELREVQCLVCSTLHQMFIMDPKLVKLVHFQGYDPELLAVTVSGIPSMHICLNFITELLNQPELEKQLFAVQLSSYLFIQFPLPKALTIAKYIFQRLTSLSEALPGDKCATFFIPACACVVRFCLAFPPLCSDASTFLLIIGQTAVSRAAGSCGEHLEFSHYRTLLEELNEKVKAKKEELQDQGFDEQSSRDIEMPVWHKLSNRTLGCKEVLLYNAVKKTFSELIDLCVLKKYGITNT